MKLGALIYTIMLSLPFQNSSKANLEVTNGSGSFYSRSRFNGELDLLNIARMDCREDLWLYSSGLWFDIGRNETTEEVLQDTAMVDYVLSLTTGTMYEYHTHSHSWCPENDGDKIRLEPLSLSDVLSHVYLSLRANSHGRRLVSRIADEHGIWTYSVSGQLRDDILNNDLNAVYMLSSNIENSVGMVEDIERGHFDYHLRHYMQFMRDSGVIVSYRRIRE